MQRSGLLLGFVFLIVLANFLPRTALTLASQKPHFNGPTPTPFPVILPVPRQGSPERKSEWTVREITFRSMAHYDLTARVVSKRNYSEAGLADLAPFDFGLVWGRVSDPDIFSQMQFKQEGRWLHWRWNEDIGLSREEIQRCVSNVHMIPANDHVRSLLTAAQVNDVIEASGELVKATDPYNQLEWTSSLTRDDIGDGACEIMWVDHVELK